MEKYAKITSPVIPVIKSEEPDKYGRDIRIGVKHNHNTIYLQTMNFEEAKALRDKLNEFISAHE